MLSLFHSFNAPIGLLAEDISTFLKGMLSRDYSNSSLTKAPQGLFGQVKVFRQTRVLVTEPREHSSGEGGHAVERGHR
jgi:hypothetical protein